MKKAAKKKTLASRRAVSGYLFILPFILGFLFFMVKPLFQSLYIALSTVDVSASGFTYTFAGLTNFKRALLIDPEFNEMLYDETTKMIINSFATIIFSFFVALLLNKKFKGRAFVRAIFFLPVIMSSGVIVGLDANNSLLSNMANLIEESTTSGVSEILEDVLSASGMASDFLDTIFGIVDSVYDVAVASGIQIIIFLSALQTIPQSMYEAAQIEGCTKWEGLWKITFPMISSLFLVNWIYTIVDFFMKTDNQIMDKMRTQMVTYMNYGFSSAMAWIYFGVVALFIAISSAIISRMVYYYE